MRFTARRIRRNSLPVLSRGLTVAAVEGVRALLGTKRRKPKRRKVTKNTPLILREVFAKDLADALVYKAQQRRDASRRRKFDENFADEKEMSALDACRK
jgi:hypothetical protein